MAAGGEGLVQPGDEAVVAPEDTSMQHPILTALEGGAQKVSGDVVMDGISEILSRLLPDVPQDDPYRPALVALGLAAGCRQTEPRSRLSAL